MIEIKNVTKKFDKLTALKEVSATRGRACIRSDRYQWCRKKYSHALHLRCIPPR